MLIKGTLPNVSNLFQSSAELQIKIIQMSGSSENLKQLDVRLGNGEGNKVREAQFITKFALTKAEFFWNLENST